MRPSFIGSVINGLVATIATILFLMHYKTMSNESIIQILFLMSIAIGIHSLLHHYEEIYYGYNPLIGKWKILDNKI